MSSSIDTNYGMFVFDSIKSSSYNLDFKFINQFGSALPHAGVA